MSERVVEAVVVVCCVVCAGEGAQRRDEFRARPVLCPQCYGILRSVGTCTTCGNPGTLRTFRRQRRRVEAVQCDSCWNERVAGAATGAFIGEFVRRVLK